MKAMNFQGEYSFDTTKADGQYRKPASNKKLLSLIGDFKFTPFEQGNVALHKRGLVILKLMLALDETVKWFLENFDTARTGKNKSA